MTERSDCKCSAEKAEAVNAQKIPAAKAVELAGLVEYAEGAIVSRTLAESTGGTMTLFAFDADQSLSEHSTPFDAAVQILDGCAELTIDGKAMQLGAGQFAIMPANVPHAVKAVGRFKMLLTMLRDK